MLQTALQKKEYAKCNVPYRDVPLDPNVRERNTLVHTITFYRKPTQLMDKELMDFASLFGACPCVAACRCLPLPAVACPCLPLPAAACRCLTEAAAPALHRAAARERRWRLRPWSLAHRPRFTATTRRLST